jgi:ribosome biogenesis GTPase
VEFEWSDNGRSGIITAIDDRSNYIIRKSSNLSREYQIIAANVDIAWLMVTIIQPVTLSAFIDRFLVSAEAYRIPGILLFNKIDLHGEAEDAEMQDRWAIYNSAGYRCMKVSLETLEGVDLVREEMSGRVNVIAGNSGVGKSTLIKALDPTASPKIGKVSGYHQSGTHTTTFSELFELDHEIDLIDTPGIKGFGTVDIEREELFHFFPEIFRESQGCRYHNCLHLNEPHCAVKEAVRMGKISESRYLNYVIMMEEEQAKYR